MAHTVASCKSGAIQIASASPGTNGVQDAVADINFVYEQASAVYGASNTQGGVGRVEGNSDWTATFKIYGAIADVLPGATLQLTGYTGTAIFQGNCIVDEITIEADIKGGGLVQATVSVSANGALSRTSGTVTDSSTPAPLSVKGLKVNYNGSDRTDATGWSLTLRSENKPYNSTATNGVTKRVAGRKDASGSWTELEADPAILPAKGETGSANILKLYVDATTFWEIKWPIIENVSTPIPVEAGDIVESTISWSFNGYSGAVGYINKPDTSAWWP